LAQKTERKITELPFCFAEPENNKQAIKVQPEIMHIAAEMKQ
jgi:hypothetical protein